MQWRTLEGFWKWVTQQSSIFNLFPSVLETTIWILKSKEDIPNICLMHYLKQSPSTGLLKTGGLDMAASDSRGPGDFKSHGHHTVINQTVLGSEKLKTDMVERKCLYIGCFKIHVYWLWPSCTDCQFVLQVFAFYRKNCCGNSFSHSTWAWPHLL